MADVSLLSSASQALLMTRSCFTSTFSENWKALRGCDPSNLSRSLHKSLFRGEAPRWVYIDAPTAEPVTDLGRVSEELRKHLGQDSIEDRPFDDLTASWLDCFLDRLNETERQLLPKKKQRALDAMEKVLRAYKKRASQQKDFPLLSILEQFRLLFSSSGRDEQGVDWGTLADSWFDLVRPHWYKLIKNPPRGARYRPLQLRDLHQILLDEPFSVKQLEGILQEHHGTPSLDLRVVAAILGIPDRPS